MYSSVIISPAHGLLEWAQLQVSLLGLSLKKSGDCALGKRIFSGFHTDTRLTWSGKGAACLFYDNFWIIWLLSIQFSEIEALKKPYFDMFQWWAGRRKKKCSCPHWEGEDSTNLTFIRDQRLNAQHTWMYFTFLAFLHQILTSSRCCKGQGNNSQVLSVVYSLEMCLIVPISMGKTMRQDSGVTCHTLPNWLAVLVRPFHALPSQPGFFFLSAPLFSIRKQ